MMDNFLVGTTSVVAGGCLSWFLVSTIQKKSSTMSTAKSTTMPQKEQQQHDTTKYKGPINHDFTNAPYDEASVLSIAGRDIPYTITTPNYSDAERCYSVSPFAHYIGYAYDEVRLHTKNKAAIISKIANAVLYTLGLVVQILQLDHVLYLNNWLLSTNLWPQNIDWTVPLVEETNERILKGILKGRHKAVVWRSVDVLSQPTLYKALSDTPGCLMVPARIVNWVDYTNTDELLKSKKNLRWDAKLFGKKVGYDVVLQKEVPVTEKTIYELYHLPSDEITYELAEQLIPLYNQLYLGKYSRRNPQFTAASLVRLVQNGFLTLTILRLREDPSVVRVFSVRIVQDNVMTYPMVGYDMSCGDKDLYRLCCILFLHEAVRTQNYRTHLSAGSNEYKRHRGAVSTVEYNAVFVEHLPWYQRWGWRVLSWALNKIITVDRAH